MYVIIEQDSIDLQLSVAEIYDRVTNEDMQTYLQSLEAVGDSFECLFVPTTASP